MPSSLPLELEAMFDRLPRMFRQEILTQDGHVERVIAKQVEGFYERSKSRTEKAAVSPLESEILATAAASGAEKRSLLWYEQVD